MRILNAVKNTINAERNRLTVIEKSGALRDPVTKLNESRRELIYFSERIASLTISEVKRNKLKYSALVGKLDALSPLGVIARGSALAEMDGKVITSVKDAALSDKVDIRLSDGVLKTIVTEIKEV